jgi:hypothetical protein
MSSSLATGSSPLAADNGFKTALAKFRARLTVEEEAKFQVTSVDDVKMVILAVQVDQRKRRAVRNLTRVKRFLEAMEQFGKIIEVFVNASDFVAFVWGPVKLLLLVSVPEFVICSY